MNSTVMMIVLLIAGAAVDLTTANDSASPTTRQRFKDTDLPSGSQFNENVPPIKESDLSSISKDERLFDQWESMAERKKKCSPTISCELAGGHCVKSKKYCDGTTDSTGCRGKKKCSCCIPDKTAPAPSTCPPVVNATCPAVTTVATCPTTETVPTTITPTIATKTTLEAVTCVTLGGERVGNQCLEFVREFVTWYNASDACVSRNGTFATLEDPQAVKDYLKIKHDGGDRFFGWAGASDEASEGDWVWVDGTAMDKEQMPWWSRQPDNNGLIEDCLTVDVNGYADYPCSSKFYYICDLGFPTTLLPTTTAATKTEAVTCATSGVLVGNQCLEFVSKELSWDNARAACVSRNGALASLEDPQAVLDYVKTISDWGWVGASDAAFEGEWKWVNGTLLDLAQITWYPGNPDNGGHAGSNCLIVNRGGYHDAPCNWWRPYICNLG